MAYRDELEALKRRIEELEQALRERTKERNRLDALNNLGPEAYGFYSSLMYRLGRAIGRAFSRRPSDPARAIEAARQRIRLLEQRLAQVEEEILQALKEADEAALKKAEEFNETRRKERAKEPD